MRQLIIVTNNRYTFNQKNLYSSDDFFPYAIYLKMKILSKAEEFFFTNLFFAKTVFVLIIIPYTF